MYILVAGHGQASRSSAYVLDDFESPDEGQFSLYELPESCLLALELLGEGGVAQHYVCPVVLQGVEGWEGGDR